MFYSQGLLQRMRIVWRHDDRAIAIVDRFHADEATPFAVAQISDGIAGLLSRIPYHGLRCLETMMVRCNTGSRSSSVSAE